MMRENHGLSIKYYIKNNKQRLLPLIVSLTVFIIMLYSMAFILEPSGEILRKILLVQAERFQIIYNDSQINGVGPLKRDLSKVQAVDDVLPCVPVHTNVDTILEKLSLGLIYLVDKKDIQTFLDYASADITHGRLPEESNEVVVDELYAKNQNLSLGDTMESRLTIVGLLKSDCYLIAGVSDNARQSHCVAVLSSGENMDYRQILEDLGYDMEELEIKDSISQRELYQKHADAEYGIYFLLKTIAVIVVIICLMVLFSLYIHDRQPELCFYYSIGFSKKDIYFSVLRKLLLIFGVSIVGAFSITLAVYFLIRIFIITPNGLSSVFVMPREILRCLSCLFLIFASLQPSIFFAMQKINTVDSLEEEMI